jgi:hypothetical protein
MTPVLTAETRVVASRNQVSTNVSGEAVILGMNDSIYYGLDPVGARIWALVQQPTSLGAVVHTLTAEYDVTAERALVDLVSLAGSLLERDLLEIAPASPA